MKKIITLASCIINLTYTQTFAQCCAGGSGSPIAGGTSQGVLLENQFELNTNFQFIKTSKFYKKDKPDTLKMFDSYNSMYEYFRLAYGVTKNLTFSLESGHYFNKKEVGLNNNPEATYQSKGIGDLIIFPRYDVINYTGENYKSEVTLGLGIKFPLGSYSDSTGQPVFGGETLYVLNPQAVQLSSGATDIIFYSFFFNSFNEYNFRIFANAVYIKKGWNPKGEKLGDFASFGLFTGKSFFNFLGVMLQVRYEWVDKMNINQNTRNSFSRHVINKPSTYTPEATGYRKLFFVPQVSFSIKQFTMYFSSDIPLYQYMNSLDNYSQAGSQFTSIVGLSYRFLVLPTEDEK